MHQLSLLLKLFKGGFSTGRFYSKKHIFVLDNLIFLLGSKFYIILLYYMHA